MKYMKQSDNFQFEQDPFSKKAEGTAEVHHEAILLIKFVYTEPRFGKMNINYYDLHYTVIKSLSDERGEI